MTIPTVSWYGCFDGNWQQAGLVEGAVVHPAKVQFGLAERIYKHMLAEGWLVPGNTILDPFAGIAGFAFHAMLNGLNYVGVELEVRFRDLAQQNIDLWNERYGASMPHWGTAKVLLGDSRFLLKVLAQAEADSCVASPPYVGIMSPQSCGIDFSKVNDAGQTRDMTREAGHANRTKWAEQNYGTTAGQLGAMASGDVSAVITSPPYAETRIDGNGDEGASGLRNPDGSYVRGSEGWAARKAMGSRYGEDDGNLGNMPAGVVTSPPYAGNDKHDYTHEERDAAPQGQGCFRGSYSRSDGQLGDMTTGKSVDTPAPDTFWSAARTIVEQTYAILKPGGVAAWVVGNYKRDRKVVDFVGQWLALCESVGFEPLLHAVAWKETDHGIQGSLLGEDKTLKTSKVSFFRRLANKRDPNAAILSESVLFVQKPLEAHRA